MRQSLCTKWYVYVAQLGISDLLSVKISLLILIDLR
jgi:hypothetical protein